MLSQMRLKVSVSRKKEQCLILPFVHNVSFCVRLDFTAHQEDVLHVV